MPPAGESPRRRLLGQSPFCTHRHTTQTCTRSKHLTGRSRAETCSPYLQEVPALAVDVDEVVAYCEQLLGLPDEEGCAVQLRLVRGEGELPLYTQHVNAPWRSGDKGLLPLPALQGDSASSRCAAKEGDRRDPPHRIRLAVRTARAS